jgi:TRAP-type C4-dicarboxylate transport system permease small subunit
MWLRIVGDAIDIAIILLATVLIALMSVNVVARTALDADIAWNVEFGEFILVWATFLGGAAAARRGAHMRITELVEIMPAGPRRFVEIGTRVVVLALLLALARFGAVIAASQMDQLMTVLYWPVGLQYAALPVGACLTALFVGNDIWRLLTRRAAAEEAVSG